MKFGDIVKCPFCNETIDNKDLEITRKNIINEDSNEFENPETICRAKDNLFVKFTCKKCNKSAYNMITLDIKPIQCYNAKSRSELVTILNE